LGYYNAFKQCRSTKKFSKANKAGPPVLPHNFHRRAKWVTVACFYQLLVEPLDIADYHCRTRGRYMTHARERHCYGERAPTCRGVWSERGGGVGTGGGTGGGSGAESGLGVLPPRMRLEEGMVDGVVGPLAQLYPKM